MEHGIWGCQFVEASCSEVVHHWRAFACPVLHKDHNIGGPLFCTVFVMINNPTIQSSSVIAGWWKWL